MSVTEHRLPFADEPTPGAPTPEAPSIDPPPADAPPTDPPLPPVQVIRSRRRRKTVEARLVDGVVRLMVPATMSPAEVDDHAVELRDRLVRRHRCDQVDLTRRARELSARYGLPVAPQVEWSNRQTRTWASCTLETGLIRVAARASSLPPWVLDYLLVHELAHLVHGDHSPSFWELCNRYPRTERARGYLMAIDHHTDEPRPDLSGGAQGDGMRSHGDD